MNQEQQDQNRAWKPQKSSSFRNRSGLALLIVFMILIAAISVIVSFLKGL